MATLTIRNVEGEVRQRLRVLAAERGHSMEEEVREILRRVVGENAAPRNLAAAIRSRVARLGGVALEIPPREPMREPPDLARR